MLKPIRAPIQIHQKSPHFLVPFFMALMDWHTKAEGGGLLALENAPPDKETAHPQNSYLVRGTGKSLC